MPWHDQGPAPRSSADDDVVRPPWDVSHLVPGLAAMAVLAVVGCPVAWLIRDGKAAAWYVAGLALTGAFFCISTLAVAWIGAHNERLVLAAALGSYVAKICALGVVLVALRDQPWVDGAALAFSVVLGVVVWLGVQIRRTLTRKMYYVDPRPDQ